MSRDTPSNNDDIIDSRDVIARIEELEGERDTLADAVVEHTDDEADRDALTEAQVALKDWEEENGDELKALKALEDEASGSADWRHGETLIRDSYFERYAEQLADDIGAINGNANWPLCHIDWEAAADSLKQDYTSVEFDGVTYWIRS